jgi:hypothetical protein
MLDDHDPEIEARCWKVAKHIWLGWEAAVEEASTHGTAATWSSYLIDWIRDTFENLQSEFWQLAVQFQLLAELFEAVSVRAYEKAQEEIKAQLDHLEGFTATSPELLSVKRFGGSPWTSYLYCLRSSGHVGGLDFAATCLYRLARG